MAPRSSLPSKKRKLAHDAQNDTPDHIAQIKSLEDQLIAAVTSKSSLNPLSDLLDIARNASDAHVLSKAMYALYRVFVVIISNGLLLASTGNDETKAVRAWIQEKIDAFVELLIGLLQDEESILKTSSLKILFSLQKHLSTAISKAPSSSSGSRPQFYVPHFRKIVEALLLCPSSPRAGSQTKKRKSDVKPHEDDKGRLDPEVRDVFMETWLSEYDDIRWFFLRESAGLLSSYNRKTHPHVPDNLLSLLERLTTFPTEVTELNKWWVEELGARPPKPKTRKGSVVSSDSDEDEETKSPGDEENADVDDDWRKFFDEPSKDGAEEKKGGPSARLHKMNIHQSLHSLASHRAVFTRAWLTLLPLLSASGQDEERAKALATRALNVMHRGVMPHLTRAVMVMDWVASCVDYGGTVGLLALNALFILMKEYNLDYPQFYTRLYTFLDRNVLHLKHRARFFRLTELFLSSTHLPVALLASFVKRLARLSLSAPPAAIVMIIPLTYNILKRHPALMVMIHRVEDSYEAFEDPFNPAEPNPTLTNALESSLWELHTHHEHYHSAVSTLARIFSEAFTKPNYSLEDFLDHTYSTLYETEARRRIKKEPAIALDAPTKEWFPSARLAAKAEGDESDVIREDADRLSSLWNF